MKKIENMPQDHQFIWHALQLLEDGERYLGRQLQDHAGVDDPRVLFQAIKDLRYGGFLVGGDKGGNRGYYEIRTEDDLNRTLRSLREPAWDLLKTAQVIERSFFEQKFGSLLPTEDEEGE